MLKFLKLRSPSAIREEKEQKRHDAIREQMEQAGLDPNSLDIEPIVTLNNVRYLGGLADTKRPRLPSQFHISSNLLGMGLRDINKAPWIPLESVLAVAVSGRQVAKSKVGAQLAFGVAGGLAAKGAEDQSVIHVRTRDGGTVLFQVDRISAEQVRGRIESPLANHGIRVYDSLDNLQAPPAAPAAPQENTADQLARLAKLHADGALTDDEFTAAKARLLS